MISFNFIYYVTYVHMLIYNYYTLDFAIVAFGNYLNDRYTLGIASVFGDISVGEGISTKSVCVRSFN